MIFDHWTYNQFYMEQTLHECIASGYSDCVAYPAIVKRWKWWDDRLAKDMESWQ